MVKIQERSNGQFVVTVDKSLAEAMDLGGAEAEWSVESGDRLSLKVVERDTDD